MVFCAAPSYLARRGRPATPEALAQHDCLLYRMEVDGKVMPWPYLREGTRVVPELQAAAVANDIDTLAMLAVHGAGITRLGWFIARPLVAQGLLEPLFLQSPRSRKAPRIAPEPLEFFLCYRDRQHVPAKVRVFAEYLAEALRDHPDLRAPA